MNAMTQKLSEINKISSKLVPVNCFHHIDIQPKITANVNIMDTINKNQSVSDQILCDYDSEIENVLIATAQYPI